MSTDAIDTKSALSEPGPQKFGTFAGVFTPSILTIFGVIMFMRAGYVVGQAGILQALAILVLAKSITLFTGLSIAAIATNTEVKSGGAYFLISRTLGPEFGGAIGLALYLAQALSVPFYILGLSEALIKSLGQFAPVSFLSMEFMSRPIPIVGTAFSGLNMIVLVVLFIVAFVGAGWAIRTQFFIMGILCAAILTFLVGAAVRFSPETLQQNFAPVYREGTNFWFIFAVYFPAVTGIMAGVNMSGNLKNPSRAMPLGTLAAIVIGLVVYAAQILLVGGAVSRDALINQPYESLLHLSTFSIAGIFLDIGFIVSAGVIAATLSSGLGSFLGAPRILQALAQDKILAPFSPFAKLSKSGEPRRALWLTFVLSVGVIWYAREGSEGGALNAIASVITMLFLCTYGITNLAAFVESYGRNPSFRPRFGLFHWSFALLGAGGCIFAAVLISPLYAILAVLIVVLLFLYVRKFILSTSFGDARRGFYYSRVRDNLFRLAGTKVHPKNWRPSTLVFSGNPETRTTLTKYAAWLGSGRGILTLASLIIGELSERKNEREEMISRLEGFISKNRIAAFPEVLVTPDLDTGVAHLLQSASIGPLKPNLVIWGWSADESRAGPTIRGYKAAHQLQMSQVVVHGTKLPEASQGKRRIDLWWRGMNNGSLMVILAYLMTLNAEWNSATIRILRVVREDSNVEEAEREMSGLMEAARMKTARVKVIVSDQPYPQILHENSHDATVVFLGFSIPEERYALRFQQWFGRLLEGLPTTLLIHSTGEADLIS